MGLGALILLLGCICWHAGLLVWAITSPAARLEAALAVIATNYGWRRLLFIDPALGEEPLAWFGLILLGDGVVVLCLLLCVIALPPARSSHWTPCDRAVLLFGVVSLGMAVSDPRLSGVVRLAHWKDEYAPMLFYALARLSCPDRHWRPHLLAALAGLAVGWAMMQAVMGPSSLDLAWIASGRSVLARDGVEGVVGLHGLGNLQAGWLRPYGFFGNGTDMGVFLAAVTALWLAVPLAPVPLLCAVGAGLTVVRFTWAVWLLTVLLTPVLAAPPGRRLGRGVLALLVLAGLGGGGAMLAAALGPDDAASLGGRALVAGTYLYRLEAQRDMLESLIEQPTLLLIGEGFGGNGAAALKFGEAGAANDSPAHHSRLLDYVQDGGIGLLLLALLPLLLASRGERGQGDDKTSDKTSGAALAFCWGLFLTAAVLGGKSALIGSLFWAMLGRVVGLRRQRLREQQA